jgi:para-nitrobenzyl esterase
VRSFSTRSPVGSSGAPLSRVPRWDSRRPLFETLSSGPEQVAAFGEWSLAFLPVMDDDTLSRHPRDVLAEADVDLLIGWTKDEASFAFGLDPRYANVSDEEVIAWMGSRTTAPERLYESYVTEGAPSPKEVLIAAYSDGMFRRPAIETVETRASRNLTTYAYEFVLRSPAYGGALGATHCMELPFTFANADRWAGTPFLGGLDGKAIESATAVMHRAWVAFITTGSPETGESTWPPYTTSEPAHAVLGTASRVAAEMSTPWR